MGDGTKCSESLSGQHERGKGVRDSWWCVWCSAELGPDTDPAPAVTPARPAAEGATYRCARCQKLRDAGETHQCIGAHACSPSGPRPEGRREDAENALRELFVAIDYDNASEGVKMCGGRVLHFIRELASAPARPEAQPTREPDLFASDANVILRRVFDEDDITEEFFAWYKPDQWFHGYRALGAFIRTKLDAAAPPAGRGGTEVTEAIEELRRAILDLPPVEFRGLNAGNGKYILRSRVNELVTRTEHRLTAALSRPGTQGERDG